MYSIDYWLWKWLETYNIDTFSTLKDKFLFNLLFWIPNSFCTFHNYASGGTPFMPPLSARHWFFIIQSFEQLSVSEKQSCPETFYCDAGPELGGCQGGPLPLQNFVWPPQWPPQNFPRDDMPLHWSPTQTTDSSPCCKTGPSSGPPKWKCLAPRLLWWNIFQFFHQDFWATCGLPWKTENALNSVYWIYTYIFFHSEFWTTCACPEK